MFPRTQILAPIGAGLTIRSTDDGARQTKITRYAGPALGTVANEATVEGGRLVASPSEMSVDTLSRGDERELRVDEAGFYAVYPGSEARAGAWVVVAGHPYHAMTDERGQFTLEEIPAGSYTLVVWHPSVFLGEGKWSPPSVVKRKVTVKAYQATKTSVALK